MIKKRLFLCLLVMFFSVLVHADINKAEKYIMSKEALIKFAKGVTKVTLTSNQTCTNAICNRIVDVALLFGGGGELFSYNYDITVEARGRSYIFKNCIIDDTVKLGIASIKICDKRKSDDNYKNIEQFGKYGSLSYFVYDEDLCNKSKAAVAAYDDSMSFACH
jgi:hypothetical protein